MRNRSNKLRTILTIFLIVVAVATYLIVDPDNLSILNKGATNLSPIIRIIFALIVGIGIAQPIVDGVNTLINTVFRRDRRLSDLREKILENQHRLWINGILRRSIENEPLIVPYEEISEIRFKLSTDGLQIEPVIDKEFREKITDRLLQSSTKAGHSHRKTNTKDVRQKNVVDAYVASNEQLVILGDGGSGKTIALLQLLEHLHNGVQEVARNHIPVVFNLGTWDEKQLPLSEWLVSEILDAFPGGPPEGAARQAAYLIKRQQVILLFDGLDEISKTNRERFYSELWEFAKNADKERVKFVLCSRPEEYMETSKKINGFKNEKGNKDVSLVVEKKSQRIHRAKDTEKSEDQDFQLSPKIIYLRPIDDDAIQQFLAGDYYDQIRSLIFGVKPIRKGKSSISHSPNKRRKGSSTTRLSEPAHHPFILNALAVGYKNPHQKDIDDLNNALNADAKSNIDPILDLVLQRYISQRFDNAELSDSGAFYDEETTNNYLSWIASKLSGHATDGWHEKGSTLHPISGNEEGRDVENIRTSISVENLQSSWLDTFGWQFAYKIVSRMLSTAAITAGVGFFLASPLDYLIPGLLAGVVIGLIDFAGTQPTIGKISEDLGETWSRIVRLLVVYFSSSIVLSIFLGLTTLSTDEDMIRIGNIHIALSGITLAWFLSLFIALIYITQDVRLRIGDVALAEKIDFAYTVMIRYALVGGVTVGTLIAVFAQILQTRSGSSTTIWLNGIRESTGMGAPLVGFLAGAFFGGVFAGLFGLLSISSMEIERTRPNQGIQKSVENSVRVGLSLTLLFSVVFIVPLWYTVQAGSQDQYDDIIYRAVRNGLTFGVLGALWSGGISTIHHIVLRFFLFLSGRSPWNLSHFLKYCSQIHIMREVGASYIFGHNYIRGYYDHHFLQTPPAKPRWSIAFMASALIITGLGFGVYHQPVSNVIYSFNEPGQLEVAGMTSSQICVEKDDAITIQSRGVIRAGDYVGYVTPEGTNIGFWGIPIGDDFDIEPSLTNNALMCKLDNETKWHTCAESPKVLFPFPWETRTFSFDANQSGCLQLQFEINEKEVAKRKGAYFVLVTVTSK